jgi:glutamine synthetase
MDDLRKAGVDHPGSIQDSLQALDDMEISLKIIKEDVAEAFAECEGDPA